MSSYDFPAVSITMRSTGVVRAHRIVRGTSTDGIVAESSAATDKHMGISGQIGVGAEGGPVSVNVHGGPVTVEYGASLEFGDPITSDADGRAVLALPGQRHIGFATENGDADTLGSCTLERGFVPAVSPEQLRAAFVAAYPPGTSGNVLTSDGDAWASATP